MVVRVWKFPGTSGIACVHLNHNILTGRKLLALNAEPAYVVPNNSFEIKTHHDFRIDGRHCVLVIDTGTLVWPEYTLFVDGFSIPVPHLISHSYNEGWSSIRETSNERVAGHSPPCRSFSSRILFWPLVSGTSYSNRSIHGRNTREAEGC